jgi:hypothetical protein
VPNVGNGSTEAFVEFFVDADNRVNFIWSAGSLIMRKREAGANSSTSITYSLVDHRYLRISESGTDLLFDTSPDATTWTNRRTVAHGMNLSAGRVVVSAGYWGTETDPGSFVIGGVNAVSVMAIGPPISTSVI